jgi:hypothetical protein
MTSPGTGSFEVRAFRIAGAAAAAWQSTEGSGSPGIPLGVVAPRRLVAEGAERRLRVRYELQS